MHMVTFAIVFMLFENEKNNWTEWLIKIIKFSGTPIEIGIFGKGSWVTNNQYHVIAFFLDIDWLHLILIT